MNATNATPHDAGQADPPRHAAHSKAIEIKRAAASKICLEDTGMRSTPLLQAIIKSSTSTCAEPMVPELRDHWQMLGLIEAAFEGETAVAVHRDINDAAQTVLVEKASVTTTTPTAPNAPGKLANTGSDINGFAATAAALLLLSGAVLALARRRAQS